MPRTKKLPPSSVNDQPSAISPIKRQLGSIRVRAFFPWIIKTLFKLGFIAVFVIAMYLIYLDGKVRNKFEGQRWQVPVQVYSQILQFSVGDKVSIAALKEELAIVGYQQVNQVLEPGDFTINNNGIALYRRAFDFGLGREAAQLIRIDISQGNVSAVYQQDRPVQTVQFEPLLLDRIVPESKEDRVLVPLEQVPSKLLNTLLLIEDRDFYFHQGVSPLGILRALYANLRAGRTVQGGSTLTQQLVKNMFLTREKTLIRKVKEALMALLLEYRYSKDQLLEAYINEVYLGQHYANGIYGFGLAAKFYFGRTIERLTPAEMALLVAQIKGPSYYDPWRYPERAQQRRDLVLKLMFEHHYLSRSEFEVAIAAPLSIRDHRRFEQRPYPAYLQLVKQELSYLLPEFAQQSGIKVFTGFSPRSQRLLERTVEQQLSTIEAQQQTSDLQTAMVVSDLQTGEIRALVGARNPTYAGFNRALQASRPIGSLVKPAVFLAALERYHEFNLATLLDDKPLTLTDDSGKHWQPKNYDGEYRGQVTLEQALVDSLNIPTVNLGMRLGLAKVADALELLGIQQPLVLRPSMLLGAINMSPLEVHQLYSTIASKGFYQQQHAINKIVDGDHELLWQSQGKPVQRMSTDGAYLINHALTKVTESGTARSLSWRLKDHQVAGKTGTSNDLRDSWFAGFDNRHLVTAWVGHDDNTPTKLTGSSGAMVLFAEFLKAQGVDDLELPMPSSIAMTNFEQKTGAAVSNDCANVSQYPAVTAGLKFDQDCQQQRKKKQSWLERLFGE